MPAQPAQTQKLPRPLPLLLFLLLLLAANCGSDSSAPPTEPLVLPTPNVLRLADAEGTAGGNATLILSLNNVTDLSALQFDLSFDPDILTVASAAATARSAGFESYVQAGNGTARVVLVDLDGVARIDTGDGAVATVTVDVDAAAAPGASSLLVEHASAVDTAATSLSVGGSNATFTVR